MSYQRVHARIIRSCEWLFGLVGLAFIGFALVSLVLKYGFGPLFLFDLVLLGFTGVVAITYDTERHSPNWGLLTWAVVGGLVGMIPFTVVRYPQLWGAIVAFLLVALLADWRRGRLLWIFIALICAVLAGWAHFYLLIIIMNPS